MVLTPETPPFLTLSIVTLIGCGPSAREQAATAYVQQMEGLFAENKAITREFINVASA